MSDEMMRVFREMDELDEWIRQNGTGSHAREEEYTKAAIVAEYVQALDAMGDGVNWLVTLARCHELTTEGLYWMGEEEWDDRVNTFIAENPRS